MKENKQPIITPAAVAAAVTGNLDNFIAAITPGGIEAQEKAGQTTFVANSSLPKEMLHGCTREKLERMGIKFGEPVDNLFISVTLPAGWKKQATDHSMWSKLLDDRGRERASIFYKAAFYDRNAHISLTRRYKVDPYLYCDKDGNRIEGYDKRPSHYACAVMDCGNEIHRIGIRPENDYKAGEELEKRGRAWLTEKFPNWQDELAYWE